MTTTLLPQRPSTESPVPVASRRWDLAGLGMLLVATAVLYTWNLAASGNANSFYAAAAQAGTQSWKALLFGSLDPGNVITVDKPPASLWLMGLSGRLLGYSSWSLLLPQALCGVAAVALLHATVKRHAGAVAGLLAGAALAVTPVAVLMFRFDNPDALLTLLLVAGAYCTARAVERAGVAWLALAGAAVGLAFLTKMLQGVLVVPAFALAYLVAAPAGLGRRLTHLLVGGASLIVSAGWFVALVAVWPAGSRPYIGGSTDNSLLELALGYNGLGRIFGGSGGPGGNAGGGGAGAGGMQNVGFGGATGIGRLFGASMGAEISWLLPAALIALVAGLWFTRRAPRTDRTRAALIVWGGWLLVTGVVFSYMSGITHPYYTVALAPAVAALAALGGRELWRARAALSARLFLAGMVFATGAWDFVLLTRDAAGWYPQLRWAVLVLTGLAAMLIASGVSALRRFAVVTLVAALLGGFGATTAWSLSTAAQPHTGSIPMSGPTGNAMGGGPGGFGEGDTDTALVTLLQASTTKWAAAISGATSAADLELASGKPVIAIGGWDGSDPAPTLAQFKSAVAAGQIHYFISGGRGGGPGGGTSDIATWVSSSFTARTVGSSTVYDLTAG